MKRIVVAVLLVLIALILSSCASKPSAREGSAVRTESVVTDAASSSDMPPLAPQPETSQPETAMHDNGSSSPVEVVTATPNVPDSSSVAPANPDDASVFYAEPEPLFTPVSTEEASSVAASVEGSTSGKATVDEPLVPSPSPGVKSSPPVSLPKTPAISAPTRVREPAPRSEPAKDVPQKNAESLSPDKAADSEERVESGIWEAGPEAAAVKPPSDKPPVAISRQVDVSKGSMLDVWYPGTGWVYLGETLAQGGLPYDTRKIDGPDTVFTFRATQAGRYILEFSRYDVIADEFLSDALSVTVTETPSSRRERVRAPDWKSLLGAAESNDIVGKNGTVSALKGVAQSSHIAVTEAPDAQIPGTSKIVSDEPLLSAVSPKTDSMDGPVASSLVPESNQGAPKDSATLLREAGDSLASGDAPRALTLLDAFFASSVANLDEGWFLRGRAYEANGPSRDVRKAIEAYKTVLEAWPESERWKESDSRVRYLTQFYIRGR